MIFITIKDSDGNDRRVNLIADKSPMILSAPRLMRAEPKSLMTALKRSRKHQAKVSEQLSKQVLDAFWALLRGFEAAHMARGEGEAHTHFRALARGELDTEDFKGTQHIYEGVLTSIMRMILLIYVEDEGLLQDSDQGLYHTSYSVTGLFQRLEQDAARYRGSMSERRGAWAQLLSLTRLVHDEGRYQGFDVPARHGYLFNPEDFEFLEGRRRGDPRSGPINAPPISDGCIHLVLSNLLVLNGERLSYRALGVEEIGSVYESMMGYDVECARAPSMVLQPKDVVVNLSELKEVKSGDRKKWLETQAELKFGDGKADKERVKALASANDENELFEALKSKLSARESSLLPMGSLYLQSGEERRRSGSHYTPRALSQPLVARALEPHFAKIRALPVARRAQKILELKICDPAMGSGAFLVEACRQLAYELVDAWRKSGRLLEEVKSEESVLEARRRVAQSCLYGVDKNPYAVSLAKLSLWLFTLSKEESFTFLDHALRCGDTLVGLTNDHIRRLTWYEAPEAPSSQLSFDFTQKFIGQALQERLKLNDDDSVQGSHKYRHLESAQQATHELQVISDALLGTFFSQTTKTKREKALAHLEQHIQTWLKNRVSQDPTQARERFALIEETSSQLAQHTPPISTFHWGLEFPEVGEGGFDCMVGNPPFVGGRNTTAIMGHAYQDWITQRFEGSQRSADLCSYFFRQAFSLIKRGGTIGFVATKSIAEGTTRDTGLKWICDHDGVIYHAVRRRRWLGRGTEVKVSTINLYKGEYKGRYVLDGDQVADIKDSLTRFAFSAKPAKLDVNKSVAFQGSITLGMGFTFDDQSKKANPLEKMREILEVRPESSERIFPYLGGRELNQDPEHRHHRYVINFGSMTEEEALQWPELLQVVKDTVYPSRSTHKNTTIRAYPWWQHWNRRETLYASIKDAPRFLLTNAQAAAHLCFSFYEGRAVFANSINVINLSDWASFAILQSRIHEVWARAFSTNLGDQLRYNPTTCFETFPRPADDLEALHEIGERYHTFRAELMNNLETREALMNGLSPEGLTDTYNKFHQSSCDLQGIVKLRELHLEMDRAVADAMGWHDLALVYDWVDEFTDRAVAEVLAEERSSTSSLLDEDEEVEHIEVKPRLTFTPEVKVDVLTRLFNMNRDL